MLNFLLETTPNNINLKHLIHDKNIDLFQLLHKINKLNLSYNNTNKYLEYACQNGHLQFIHWFTSELCYNSATESLIDYETLFYEACIKNHIIIAKYFVATLDSIKYKKSVKYTFCRACEYGLIDLVKWLDEEFTINIHEFYHYAFRWASNNGHFDIVKWLHNKEKVDEEDIIFDSFISSFVNGHIDIVLWLLSNYRYVINMVERDDLIYKVCVSGKHHMVSHIMSVCQNSEDITVNWDDVFCIVCKYGYIDTAKWILDDPLSINPNMKIPNSRAFLFACEFGDLDIVQWLYSICDDIHTSIIQETFIKCCQHGKLDIAKWIYDLPEFIKSESVMDVSFRKALLNKHLDLARWLYTDNCSKIDIHCEGELAFRKGCEADNLEFIEWLYAIDSTINIRALDDHCFIYVCRNNYIEIAQWLLNKCEDYFLNIVDDEILDYKVISVLDRAIKVIDDDYKKSLEILKITETSANKNDMYCVICRSDKEKVIKTPCNHIYCLHCLLSWFISTKAKDNFRCAYCRNIFTFTNCISIE